MGRKLAETRVLDAFQLNADAGFEVCNGAFLAPGQSDPGGFAQVNQKRVFANAHGNRAFELADVDDQALARTKPLQVEVVQGSRAIDERSLRIRSRHGADAIAHPKLRE